MLTEAEQDLVRQVDVLLDEGAGPLYQQQYLAQHWARVCKLQEEMGEVVDALIGWTVQNPRKGEYSSPQEMYKELCDVICTGIFALQHFTKDSRRTADLLTAHLAFLKGRLERGHAKEAQNASADGESQSEHDQPTEIPPQNGSSHDRGTVRGDSPTSKWRLLPLWTTWGHKIPSRRSRP